MAIIRFQTNQGRGPYSGSPLWREVPLPDSRSQAELDSQRTWSPRLEALRYFLKVRTGTAVLSTGMLFEAGRSAARQARPDCSAIAPQRRADTPRKVFDFKGHLRHKSGDAPQGTQKQSHCGTRVFSRGSPAFRVIVKSVGLAIRQVEPGPGWCLHGGFPVQQTGKSPHKELRNSPTAVLGCFPVAVLRSESSSIS